MKKILLILAFILFCYKGTGQYIFTYTNILNNEIYDIESIKSVKSITYYGLDFSLLKFIKPQNANEDQELRKYLGAWLAFYQKQIPPKNYLFRWLKFDKYYFNSNSVQLRLDSVPKEWVGITAPEVTIEDVTKAIQGYNLGKDNGIGFVIHPVEFNNLEEEAKCFFTFFDIPTKKVLWISETKGYVSGIGVTQWYGFAMVDCTKHYIDYIYRKNIRQ
jgi:hypothetical protein